MIPARLIEALARRVTETRRLHEADLRAGAGRVMLPDALARKFPWADRGFA